MELTELSTKKLRELERNCLNAFDCGQIDLKLLDTVTEIDTVLIDRHRAQAQARRNRKVLLRDYLTR